MKHGPAGPAALCVMLFPAYLYVERCWRSTRSRLRLRRLSMECSPLLTGHWSETPGFGVGRWLADHRAIRSTAYLAYQGAPVVFVAGAGLYRRRRPQRRFDVLVGVVVAGALGFALYSIVPAAGPIYRWGAAFPLHPPHELAPTLERAAGYPNAMPVGSHGMRRHHAGRTLAGRPQGASLWRSLRRSHVDRHSRLRSALSHRFDRGRPVRYDGVVSRAAAAELAPLIVAGVRRARGRMALLVAVGGRPGYRTERRVAGDDCRRGPQRWGAVVDEPL